MPTDQVAEIRASFFAECDELMETLQDALVLLDDGQNDSETVNVVFRAVHSIKGGAGAFGLAGLVAFAHRFETVLDELRLGRLDITPDAIRLFFRAADILHDHIRAAQFDQGPPQDAKDVLAALDALMPDGVAEAEDAIDFTPAALNFDFGAAEPGSADDRTGAIARRIDFRPRAGFYDSGNEALLILRALSALGQMRTTCAVPADLDLSVASAETPRLGWIVDLAGTATDAQIDEVFDFVADVCDLDVAVIDATNPTGGTKEAVNAPERTLPCEDGPGLAPAINGGAGAPDEVATSLLPQPNPAAEIAPVTVRVDLERVDRLMNLVGELVINQAMLAQSVAEAGLADHGGVTNGLEEFLMLTRDIQDSVMLIRAQPVKPLFQRIARIIREASSATGKEIRLRTEGEATEIDRTVIERLSDPLTHMIRNAVDHGIETPDRRIAVGKPAQGSITLSATHRGGRVLIEVADDGAGIDRRRVREIAIARGLIPPDALLSDPEIDNLLFTPGFSTSSQVSALSGRGVGMDVVKSAITALGGRMAMFSTAGVGTSFAISLPLTLAVLDGMIVRVAAQTVVLPLSAVIETTVLSRQNIRRLGRSVDVLQLRGELVPLFDLGAQLGFRTPIGACDSAIAILVARANGSRAALIVDEILEQRQVVIKGLGRDHDRIPGVAGATILGNGRIALILDPSDLACPRSALVARELALAG